MTNKKPVWHNSISQIFKIAQKLKDNENYYPDLSDSERYLLHETGILLEKVGLYLHLYETTSDERRKADIRTKIHAVKELMRELL